MTWLDRVLATPSVGLTLKPELYSEHEIFSSVRPLFDKWSKEGDVKVGQAELTLSFGTALGFIFTVRPDTIVVEFKCKFELKQRPGLLPVFPNVEAKKYSELLETTVQQTNDFVDHILAIRRRTLTRIGVVAATRIDGECPPPGVASYIKHLQRPWQSPLIRCDSNLLSLLAEDTNKREQCHHRLIFNQADEDKKNDFGLTLDWQRVMITPVELKSGAAQQHLQSSCSSALTYFERFGTGELEYGFSD